MDISALAAQLEDQVCGYPGTRQALEKWISEQVRSARNAAVPADLLVGMLQGSYLLHVQTLLDADQWDSGQ